ncbi:DciA family protein [Candidatus Chlamydia sanziniae]|uniref:Zn-ribbon-containing protein n=1 Tax=Candidatus Chlamydia sanziniae TaxID=1806891 RepID=A0A1A9HX53_9CHLA|nr:DciA family protein [Candidatus Chlamydia sanziniae]ANH79021.1 Zn-ribbon-containing protein [Candidatus Chlamydia sanziniae]
MFLRRKRHPLKKTASPIKHAKHYLYSYLKDIERILAAHPQEIVEAWNKILEGKYKEMSRAIGFKEQVLLVKVYNSSLYALLKQTDQSDLITCLHKIVPHAQIQGIQFLLG